MLELPEVEVLRKDLEKEVIGKRVKAATALAPSIVRPFHRTRPDFAKALEGRRIRSARRRGAVLFLDLDEELTWVIDPGTNGTLHRETANAEPSDSTLLVVTFTIGGALHLSDSARTPTARTGVVPSPEALDAAGLSATALDPLDDNPTWPEFGHLLRHQARPLKQVLTDPAVMLGLGVVYSDEILWEAGLRYDRSSESLSTQEVRRLYRAMHEVIHAAIKQRGTSLDDAIPEETDEEAEPAEHIKVYGREGLPCYRCRQTLAKHRLKNRTFTFYCEQCQI